MCDPGCLYEMVHLPNIAKIFYEVTVNKYGETTNPTGEEIELASKVIAIFEGVNESTMFVMEEEETLEINDQKPETEKDELFVNEPCSGLSINQEYFSIAYMRAVVSMAARCNFKCVKHRFRRLKDPSYISRFRNYLENHGTKQQKLNDLVVHLKKSFQHARENFLPVHDVDLQRWAVEKARQLNLRDFKASACWLHTIKTKLNVTSRKITKFITTNFVQQKEATEISVNTFINETKEEIGRFCPSLVLNTDQSGFNYEITSNRTLSSVGEKSTLALVSSQNAITHSYTIQPIISMEGKLLSPLFLCLKEPSGKFGPIVSKNLRPAPNLRVHCSSSGKMTKELVTKFIMECLEPNVDQKCLLLFDSWKGQTGTEVYTTALPQGKQPQIIIIPPNTTALLQPLDVFFFRQWKIFAKQIYHHILLNQLKIKMQDRNNIILMQSLIHNQLSSPKFYNLIKYAWHKSGYLEGVPATFQNVLEVCFDFSYDANCSIATCQERVFLVCSWCECCLCFKHFFLDNHFH